MKKKNLLFVLTFVLMFGLLSTSAFGYITRGDMEMELDKSSLTLESSKSETVSIDVTGLGDSLWEDLQLPGCGMEECPKTCGEKNCLKESPYHQGVFDCICEGEEYETYETEITVKSSDESVATVSYDNHAITVTAVGEGSADITVRCELREWNPAEETLTVTLQKGDDNSGTSDNNGNNGSNNGSNSSSGNSNVGKPNDNKKPDETQIDKTKVDDNKIDVVKPGNPVKFNDVADNFWGKEYIDYLSARSIIGGKTADTFAPNDTITRAEFVKILAGVAGADVSKAAAGKFSDVAAEAWYAPYVTWANQAGVAQGADGKFSPNAKISRQEIATMLYRYTNDTVKKQMPDKVAAVDFADGGQIADFAKDAVKALQQAGIIGGKENNMFVPNASATRAEAAKMIAVFMQLG